MKILVTGGAGFIASHIVDAYIAEGHQVAVVDNLSSGKRENINPKAKFFPLDIFIDNKSERSGSLIGQFFQEEKFDFVNHHAAQIDVRRSVADPVYDAQVNILGSINILEKCRKTGVKKIIFASSGGVMYGECAGNAPSEEVLPKPVSPYGVSKHSIEHYLHYYREIYGLNYTIFRYGNVYGPRQDPHGEAGVVAIFCQQMLADKPVHIFGDGEQQRDYVYVGDIVGASLIALDKGDGEIFNLGTGNTYTVNSLFSRLKEIIRYKQNPLYQPSRSGELFQSALNVAKALQLLDWKTKVDFLTGLKKTVEYFGKKL